MRSAAAARPIAEGLFTWPRDNPALLCSRCQRCGRAAFPAQNSCPACCSGEVRIEELPRRGTLWTYTIQRFMPKPPYNSAETRDTFQPYGVGYVEFPGAVRVEGIHPFGRTAERSGMQQGAFAARAAMQDAGVDFKDMEFACGGSHSAGSADALVRELGLTGLPFTNVANGCATGGSALMSACHAIKSGGFDIGLVVGFDQHERGAFNADPQSLGIDAWYGETGLMLTTQFFAMKIARYMHEYGISRRALARVAEKASVLRGGRQ